ncbi:MAG: hypothetical protein GTO24_15420 [candidate division Zixibacteria bacterium]|nr:hypothetical protein [candidate division Zixibacteria bacterium]
MVSNSFRKAILEHLEKSGVKGPRDQAKTLRLDEKVFNDFFVENLTTKEISKKVARKTIDGLTDWVETKGKERARKRIIERFIDALKDVYKGDFRGATRINAQNEKNWRTGRVKPQMNTFKVIFKKIQEFNESKCAEEKKHLIRPIFRFERIWPGKVGAAAWRIFKERDGSEREEIRKNLGGKAGVFLLYDSSAKLVYVGQTKKDLYFEICQRLETKKVQLVLGRSRRLVPLGDIAKYMSCYTISEPGLVDDIEALLITADPNASTNKKMEPMSDERVQKAA